MAGSEGPAEVSAMTRKKVFIPGVNPVMAPREVEFDTRLVIVVHDAPPFTLFSTE